jgi:hypothetical protein
MKKYLYQLVILTFFSTLTIPTFSQSWTSINSNYVLTPSAVNVGIGANANSDAKLTIHGVTKYGIQLTNSGLLNEEPYPTKNANGIYCKSCSCCRNGKRRN